MDELTKLVKRLRVNEPLVKIALPNGPNNIYYVPAVLLRNVSEYLDHAIDTGTLNSTCNLGSSGYEKRAFELFLYWLCNQRLPIDLLEHGDTNVSKAAEDQKVLVQLWDFADKNRIPKLQDESMRTLLAAMSLIQPPSPAVVRFAIELTTKHSLAFKAVVHEQKFASEQQRPDNEGGMAFVSIPGFAKEFLSLVTHDQHASHPINIGKYMVERTVSGRGVERD